MRKDTEIEQERRGILLAEGPHGPLRLVRVADVCLLVFREARFWAGQGMPACTLANAAELTCDLLEAEEASGGLELFRTRDGLALQLCRDPLPPLSRSWRPGDDVPPGYRIERRAGGPRTWERFARTPTKRPVNPLSDWPLAEFLVWEGPGAEPDRFHGYSWVDELGVRTVFSHRAELFGSLNEPELQSPVSDDLSRLAVSADLLPRLWMHAEVLLGLESGRAGLGIVGGQPDATHDELAPLPDFKKGFKWRPCDLERFAIAYAAAKRTHKKAAALAALAAAGWANSGATLGKRTTPARKTRAECSKRHAVVR